MQLCIKIQYIFAVILYLFCSASVEITAHTLTVITMIYTILVFRPPKSLLSGGLEQKTSIDIERILVGESMLSL